MAVTVYRSSDASAPALSGTVGALTALLDACLVTGYGSQAAAGWTKPYSGTNKAVFRPGGGVQHYFRFLDDGSDATDTAKVAKLIGYETMSGVDTGSGLFPTAAQLTTGVFCRKSTTADATARSWIVVADDRTCYVFAYTGDTASRAIGYAFGEIKSLMATDNYRSFVVARSGTGGTTGSEVLPTIAAGSGLNTAVGSYLARPYTGVGSSQQFGRFGDLRGGISGTLAGGGLAVPNGADAKLHLAPVHINESSSQVRGRMRGFFHLCHSSSLFSDGDTIVGSGEYAGHTFLVVFAQFSPGAYCIDITGPWETS